MKPDPRIYHGLAGDVVRELQPYHEADPVGVLVSFLTMYGAYLGPSPYAHAGGVRHAGRLNALLVGRSAKARKGTATTVAGLVFERVDREWFLNRCLGGLASGEALIAQVADTEDTVRRDRRLLVIESEFGRVLAVGARQGSILSAVIRQAWDSGRIANITKADPHVVNGAHIAMIGHVTEHELATRLADVDVANGFLNRFALFRVGRHQLLPSASPPPDVLLDGLARETRTAAEDARKAGTYKRTDAAEKLWAAVYEALAEDDPTGQLGSAVARADAHVLRLSVVYAAVDGARAIDTEHIVAAYELWRVARATAGRLFRTALPDPDRDHLLSALLDAGDAGLTRTEVSGVFHRNRDRHDLDRLVSDLTDAGLAHESVDRSGNGPPIRRLRITQAGTNHEIGEVDEPGPVLPPVDSLVSSDSYFVAPRRKAS